MDGTEVKSYSVAKNGKQKLAPHFTVKEFACSDGTDTVFISDKLVDVLEKIRIHVGKAVYITSAYRTEAKNKAVGGATYSQHKYGTAADIYVVGMKQENLAKIAEKYLPNTGGIGIYGSFVHVDVRPQKSRWNG